jgi:hypothetical protein
LRKERAVFAEVYSAKFNGNCIDAGAHWPCSWKRNQCSEPSKAIAAAILIFVDGWEWRREKTIVYVIPWNY